MGSLGTSRRYDLQELKILQLVGETVAGRADFELVITPLTLTILYTAQGLCEPDCPTKAYPRIDQVSMSALDLVWTLVWTLDLVWTLGKVVF